MLGRCCSASCVPRPSACAPRPFVSEAASARPQQHQQLRPCSGAQHRPATATVVAAASRGGGGRGSSAGRSTSTTGRGRGMTAAGGINAKYLNSQISRCTDADVLMQLVRQHAASFNYIHVSTALVRAANLMQPPLSADEEACVRQLVQLASVRLADCGSQALANMAWALAKLEYNDRTFLQQLAQQAKHILPRFKSQEVVNTLWAIAKLGHEDRTFARRLLEHARCKLPDFNPQDAANLLLAMAKLQHVAEDRQLVEQLVVYAQPQLPDFNEQELANTAWALATLQHYDQGFMQQLLAVAQPHLQHFKAQELSNTAWALASLRHYDQHFMEQLLHQVMAKVSGLNSQDISNTLWALATFGHSDPACVDKAVRRLLSLAPEEIKDQELSNTSWALSMLQHDANPVAGPLFTAAEARFAASVSPAAECASELQLRQVHRYLITMEGAGHFSKQLQASPQYLRLRHDCQAAFIREVNEDRSKIPRLAAAVIEELWKLPGCGGAQLVQLTEDQQLMMNIVVTLPCNTKVAVEAVSRAACMANAPDKPLGPLLWRHKQLAARGYKVVVVKEAAWRDVGPEMQQMYLRIRFREAGVVLPAAGA